MSLLARVGVGVCMVLVLLALGLKIAGASWENVAFAVIPLAVAIALVAAEPRLHGLTRPRPKLVLTVEGAPNGTLESVCPAPWPLDADRIVANETGEALDTVRDSRALPTWLTRGAGLTAPPTAEDHQRAKDEFKAEVEVYESELRAWLEEYSQAAIARLETFEVSLAVSNASGAAHAEAVEVVLELPESVYLGSAEHRVKAPPIRPTYRPPQPRTVFPSHTPVWPGPSPVVSVRRDLGHTFDRVVSGLRSKDGWDESSDRRRLTAPRYELQPGRTVGVAEPLWLRAKGTGVHEILWSVYSQSLSEPVRGLFKLIVPEGDPTRPPFGRVEGILRFPDAEIARGGDEDGDTDEAKPTESAVRSVRSSDPPLAPPALSVDDDDDEADVVARLRAASRRWEWEALGLDPEFDGPSSNRAKVSEAKPRDSAE